MTDEYYLDTNFFLYSSNKTSPFYKSCTRFIKHCQDEDILLSTSAETFQEIIHYTQNTKQLDFGIKVANKTLSIVDKVYPVNKQVIIRFLGLIKKYSNQKSRDVLHLSICVENQLATIITFDSDFKKFEEIKVLTPENIL